MTDVRWKQRYSNYINSLVEFKKLVDIPSQQKLSIIERTALIKFFEISNQLAIDLMMDYLKDDSPGKRFAKEVAREAFKFGIIADGQVWIDIIDGRNEAAHAYNEETANTLERAIRTKYFSAFQALAEYFSRIDES